MSRRRIDPVSTATWLTIAAICVGTWAVIAVLIWRAVT